MGGKMSKPPGLLLPRRPKPKQQRQQQPNQAPKSGNSLPQNQVPKPQQQKQQSLPPPQQQQQQSPPLYRALYDFEGQSEGDLVFRRGDVIVVKETAGLASGGGQWLLGQVAGTDRCGYVPSNFLADLPPDDPKLLPGYYSFGRADAEKELVRPAHPAGAFIVRPCASSSEALALSVKYRHLDQFKIYHYKIKRDPGSNQVYITDSKKCHSVRLLLDFYTEEAGLVCKLAGPVDINTKPVVPFRELVIEEQLIKCTARLGSGSFGVVLRGKLNKIDVAVKQLKMVGSSINTEDSLVEEAQTQYRLSHRNIIQLIGFTRTKTGEFWLIMEYAEKGSLHGQLVKSAVEFHQQLDYIRQVANGMAYLEKEKVVHRDLRAANILLTSKDEVKIADFGLARVIEKSDSLYTVEAVGVYNGGDACKFPIRWTAPEGINKHEFSVKSDVWSFGVCVYEVLSGAKKPYIGMSNQQVIDTVNSERRLGNPLEAKFDEKDPRNKQAKFLYEEVMLRCWHRNPMNRPTFQSLSATFEDFENVAHSQYTMYD